MGLIDVFSHFEPKSFFEDGLNEIGVVSFANEDFERILIFFNFQRNKQMVSKVDCEKKFSKLLQLNINWCLMTNGLIHVRNIQFFIQHPCSMLGMSK
jgi:hypothetical protein